MATKKIGGTMEEIKLTVEKIFDQFTNDTTTFSLPKRSSFNNSDDPFESLTKKRKRSSEYLLPSAIPIMNKSINDESINNQSSVSHSSLNLSNCSIRSSQWELRRLKADMNDYQTQITGLKRELEQTALAHRHKEDTLETKNKVLERQLENNTKKITDLEKHLKYVRRKESTGKEELVKLKNLMNQQKFNYDELLSSLQRKYQLEEDEARSTKNRLSCEITDLKQKIFEYETKLTMVQMELDEAVRANGILKEKAQNHDEMERTLEREKEKLSTADRRIKDLEYEIESYAEYKDLSKTFQSRLAKMPDLERELERLTKDNRNLKDVIGNKLLLEEQVYDLKTRLERHEKASDEQIVLRTKLQALEQELKNWKAIGTDHCLPNTQITPANLRARIQIILQNDLIISDEKKTAKMEKDTVSGQMHEIKKDLQLQIKLNGDLQGTINQYKTLLQRVQKKLLLVAKERDCYKQLIENYEKDLTISGAMQSELSPESQIRMRLEMLEKALAGYKELCSNLEKELEATKTAPDTNGIDMLTASNDSYDRLKKELETLRNDNERLRRRKDELELLAEHSSMKNAYNLEKYKVVHMAQNPADDAHATHKEEVDKLRAEIERLKRRNRKLEDDNAEITMRLNDTSNLTMDFKEMGNLKGQIKSLENKIQDMKDTYRTASLEFREVCNMMFGYRVDRLNYGKQYKVTSVFADNDQEYLKFQLSDAGNLEMLHTEYLNSLEEMLQTNLTRPNALPAFMSTLTLELYNQSTI